MSHSSDTSQTDTMTSVTSSSLDSDEVDLSGLVESVVDSDEEDIAESIDVSFFAFFLCCDDYLVNFFLEHECPRYGARVLGERSDRPYDG